MSSDSSEASAEDRIMGRIICIFKRQREVNADILLLVESYFATHSIVYSLARQWIHLRLPGTDWMTCYEELLESAQPRNNVLCYNDALTVYDLSTPFSSARTRP